MRLHDKQVRFDDWAFGNATIVGACGLRAKAREDGLVAVIDEVSRGLAQALWNVKNALGIANSVHRDRLAVDILLFTPEGVYLTAEAFYRPLGEWWESLLIPGCTPCWGGRFRDRKGRLTGDWGHFSFEHEGRR